VLRLTEVRVAAERECDGSPPSNRGPAPLVEARRRANDVRILRARLQLRSRLVTAGGRRKSSKPGWNRTWCHLAFDVAPTYRHTFHHQLALHGTDKGWAMDDVPSEDRSAVLEQEDVVDVHYERRAIIHMARQGKLLNPGDEAAQDRPEALDRGRFAR
jgi:hypothetical protein